MRHGEQDQGGTTPPSPRFPRVRPDRASDGAAERNGDAATTQQPAPENGHALRALPRITPPEDVHHNGHSARRTSESGSAALGRRHDARVEAERPALRRRNAQRVTVQQAPRDRHERQLAFDHAIATSMVEGLYTLDSDGRVTFINQAGQRMLGWSEGELLGQEMHTIIHCRRPDGSPFPAEQCPLLGVIRTGEVVRVDDDVFMRKDGSLLPVAYVSAPAMLDGEVVGAVLAFHDITRQKHAERRSALEYAISRTLAQAESIEQAAPDLVRAIGEGLHWPLVALWLVDDTAGVMRCAALWHDERVHASSFVRATRDVTFQPGEGLVGRVWASGKGTIIPDVQREEAFSRKAPATKSRLRAAVLLPVHGLQRVLAVIESFDTSAEPPDADVLQTVTGLASQIGQFLERQHALVAVRQSESRLEAMLQTAPECMITMDASGRITAFNPAAERTFGFSREQAIGAPLDELLIPPRLRLRFREGLRQYLATGEAHVLGRRIETQALHASGEEIPVELTVTRIPVPGPALFTAHLRDVTDRKLAAELQERHARHDALRADVGAILTEAASLDAMLLHVAEAVVRVLGAAASAIWLVDPRQGTLALRGVAGGAVLPEEQLGRIKIGELQVGMIAASRAPCVTNDVLRDVLSGDPTWAEREGLAAFAGYPLVAEDRVLGVLGLFARRSLPADAADLLGSVASLISQGIVRKGIEAERAALLERERDARAAAEAATARVEALQSITEAALSFYSLDDLLPEILGRLQRSLRVDSAVVLLPDAQGKYLQMRAAVGFANLPTEQIRVAVGSGVSGRIAATRAPLVIEDLTTTEVAYRPVAGAMCSLAGVPLLIEGSVVGVLEAMTREPRVFTNDDVHLLRLVADRVALAIDRARAYEAERAAHAAAEASNHTLRALQEINESVLEHEHIGDLVPDLLHSVHDVMQVDNAAILLLSADGKELTIRGVYGPEEAVTGDVHVPLGQGFAGRIATSREPLVIKDVRAADVVNPFLRAHLRSMAGVPLVADDRVLGVLHVGTTSPRDFAPNEVALLQLVADRIALAIDRARAAEAERAARDAAELLQRRFALLAAASDVLYASHDYEQTLTEVARMIMPQLGDWCLVDLVDEQENIKRLAIAHHDRDELDLAEQLRDELPSSMSEGHPTVRVLHTGEPVILPDVESVLEDIVAAQGLDRRVYDRLSGLGLTSFMSVPIRARDATLGAITLLAAHHSHRYTLEDLALAMDLGRRAALAIENARLYGQMRDALRQVEETADQLLMHASQLNTILQAIPGAVFVCDADGIVRRVSPYAATLLGTLASYDEADAYVIRGSIFYPDGSPMPLDDYPLAHALRGETSTDFRCMMRRFDTGEEIQLLMSFAPIRNAEHEITGAVAVGNDVTKIYRLEQQKDEFLGVASHELKTPLTSLKILAQLTHRRLDRSGSSESEQLAGMERSIGRMERLVADLLDVSRIHNGKLALRIERCDLAEICRQAAAEQSAAAERDVLLDLPDGPVPAEVDSERVGQVLINLVSNAIKYSPANCPVSLELRATPEVASFSVRDEGGGIPAEAQEHLFERYYRVPGVQVQSGSGVGLGLGLYICREIVERHGGSIWVESDVGQGTTFRVELPRLTRARETSTPSSFE